MERSALAEIDRLRVLRVLGFRSDRDIRVLATVATEKGGIDAYIGVARRAGPAARVALRFAVERPHRDHSSAAGCPERERQRHPATKRGGPPQAAAPSIWGE
ncbi:hypothetical protein [Frankia sp. EAN1pec]|uniref:hypothetical protein n=1 Tax=Parafrankia sp. (strain EAN1pec) TaxID=298653 RepID=UPI0000541DBC